MTITEFMTLLTRASFLVIALLTLVDFLRFRDRTRLDIALLFGAFGVAVVGQQFQALRELPLRWVTLIIQFAIMAFPYLALRVVNHFRPVPRWLWRLGIAGLAASWIGLVVLPAPLPGPASLSMALHFVVIMVYVSWIFVRGAVKTRGVTGHRLRLAAVGSGLVAGVILVAGLQSVIPAVGDVLRPITSLMSVLCGLF